MKITTTKTVMRYGDNDADLVFVGHAWNHGNGQWRVSCSYDIEEAMDFSDFSKGDLSEVFMCFMEMYEDMSCELVKITTTIEEEDCSEFDDGEIKEIRQKIALNKLTEQDIKALGITSIATYIKTKYHNA